MVDLLTPQQKAQDILSDIKFELGMLTKQLEESFHPFTIPHRANHQELIEICHKLLVDEGYPEAAIRREFPVAVAGKTFLADIAVVDKDDKPIVLVECGNLSDNRKLFLFPAMASRFIWIPYVNIGTFEQLKATQFRMMHILESYKRLFQEIQAIEPL